MHARYEDITSLTNDPPQWWDSNGVPRYWSFHPNYSPCIYAKEVCLLRIVCQYCSKKFDVEMNWYPMPGKEESLSERIKRSTNCKLYESELHYGDPPCHGCVGDTMNCSDRQVLEFWRRREHPLSGWERVPELEVVLETVP